ncbi:penicillin acylase family protein [Actinomadura sp. HBU206391]|nr:penicillin acylase family protein [Actinomadura sp. HBU206391]
MVVVVRTYVMPENGDERYSAQIRRTEYGIPHVTAKDHGGLGYGYGYAFAQDNLCVMASRVVTLRGERSKYFDAGVPSDDPVEPVSNLASDIYYKGVLASGVLRRTLARPAPHGPTPELRRMVDGYVAGYNRYLRDTGVKRLPDPTCRGKAWVHPITALDIWSNILDVNRAGTADFKEAIATATPAGAGATGSGGPRAVPTTAVPKAGTTAPGSNAWALGRKATRDGHGMLLADPHLPWNGAWRLYQVQLTIPGVLNVSGASLYGTPVVEIGHTTGVAWTHAVSHAPRFTLHQLALAPGEPTSYVVDGRAESMGRQKVNVTLRDPVGGTVTVTRTLYTSRYGPVLATGWTTRTAFALADANASNLRSMNEWLAMGAVQNLAQLRTAQNTYQGVPSYYTLATDTSGTTYFADSSVVPHVTDAQAKRCISTPEGKARYPETLVLDGSTSSCGWGKDPDAIEPGIFGPGRYPTLTRTDYVANSNDSPWLTNPSAPLTDYPRIYGDTRTERRLRARLSLDLISQRLAGTDGLGPPGFTLETLQATAIGKRNYSAELTRADLLATCRTHPVMTATDGRRINVRQACDTLSAWDGRADLDSRGAILWREFFTRLGRSGRVVAPADSSPPTPDGPPPTPKPASAKDTASGDSKEPETGRWRVPFDPAHPLITPRGLDRKNPAVQRALVDTVQRLQNNRTPFALTPADAQRYASIPIPGCTDEEGCFDRIDSSGPIGGGRYPDVDGGSSFLMAIELTPNGPRTRTLLTYSQSANPASPHHTDQTALFSRSQWITERFTEAEINATPHLQTTALRG